MKQMTPSDNDRHYAPLNPPRALRLVLMSMIAVCGVLMIAIVVSQPSVTGRVQDEEIHASTQNQPQITYGEAAAVHSVGPAPETTMTSPFLSSDTPISQKPSRQGSEHLPIDRVPVRRGGIVSGK